MAKHNFLFVPVDGPTSRQGMTKPASQRYTKAARKHVMKDIGFARRKDKNGKASTSKEVDPDLVDGVWNHSLRVKAFQHHSHHCADVQPESSDSSIAKCLPLDGQVAFTTANELVLPVVPSNLGSYRRDPFVRYPVYMTVSVS